jgi:hypothetical protein
VAVVLNATERRRTPRGEPAALGWDAAAVLRPGRAVDVLDLGRGGALVESAQPLRPDSRAELQLSAVEARAAVTATVARCWVAALAPLRYRARLVFLEPLL